MSRVDLVSILSPYGGCTCSELSQVEVFAAHSYQFISDYGPVNTEAGVFGSPSPRREIG